MIYLGLKCFIIEGECLFPITATLIYWFPIILLLVVSTVILTKLRNMKGEGK